MSRIFILLLSAFFTSVLHAEEDYKSLFQQARQLEQQQQSSQALPLYQKALALSLARDPKAAGSIAFVLGNLYQQMQDFAQAEASFKTSLAQRQRAFGQRHQAISASLNALGQLYVNLGDYPQAEALLQQALEADKALLGEAHPNVATRLNNLAELHRIRGEFDKAEQLYQQALNIDEAHYGKDNPRAAIRLTNLAELRREQGEYAESKRLLEEALRREQAAVAKNEWPPERIGVLFNNIGRLYQHLGDYQKALNYYTQALANWESVPGKESTYYATGLSNRGWLYHSLGQDAAAEQDYREALRISQKLLGDTHPQVAGILNNLGLLQLERGEHEAAEANLQQAQQIWQQRFDAYHPRFAMTIINQAKLAEARKDYEQAETLLHQALAIAQTAEQPELLWIVYYHLSRILAQQQHSEAAILLAKQAVNTLQSLRARLAQMDKELQHSFLKDKEKAYKHLLQLLSEAGRMSEVQQIHRMLKEEEYFDFIRRDDDAQQHHSTQATYTEHERPWVQRAQQVQARFAALGQRLRQWRSQASLSDQEQQQRQQAHSQVALHLEAFGDFIGKLKSALHLRQEQLMLRRLEHAGPPRIKALLARYRQLKDKAGLNAQERQRLDVWRKQLEQAHQQLSHCAQDLTTQGKLSTQHLSEEVRKTQDMLAKLGEGATLVHYLVLPTQIRIIATNAEQQLCRDVSISEEQLDQQITHFVQLLSQAPDAAPAARKQALDELNAQAQQLYQLLIVPLSEDLQQLHSETLMISADGQLRHIPFSALFNGEKYLVEQFKIALFTAATQEQIHSQPAREWSIYGLGLSQEIPGFNALPSVQDELERIIRRDDQDPDGVIPGNYSLNQTFTAEALSEVLRTRRYPVLHIASHFVFQPSTEQDSYLLLGDGQPLSMANIRKEYDFHGVELLTLSACQTAVGSYTKGREVECLAVLAQKQGAKSVLATLWQVDDQSTGQFMQRLYEIYSSQPGISKAAALGQAQQEFIQAAKTSLERRLGRLQDSSVPDYPLAYEHPYYWAPFVLMGNWL